MIRALVDHIPHHLQAIQLSEEESHHLRSVLRLEEGDTLELLDGSSQFVKAEIVFKGKSLWAQPLSEPSTDPSRISQPISLLMGVLKGESMEWVLEKATELGVRDFYPITTEFTVVQIHKKPVETFVERWQRISDQSLKQCGRLDRMIIHTPQTLESALKTQKKVLWLDENAPSLSFKLNQLPNDGAQPVSVLVGPEGGFSHKEKTRLLQLTEAQSPSENLKVIRTSLGSVILRAETAAIASVAAIKFRWEKQ